MFAFWGRYGMDEVFGTPEGWEVQNLLTVGQLMTRAALVRAESRGTHQRIDCPNLDATQLHRTAWQIDRSEPVMQQIGAAVVAQ